MIYFILASLLFGNIFLFVLWLKQKKIIAAKNRDIDELLQTNDDLKFGIWKEQAKPQKQEKTTLLEELIKQGLNQRKTEREMRIYSILAQQQAQASFNHNKSIFAAQQAAAKQNTNSVLSGLVGSSGFWE